MGERTSNPSGDQEISVYFKTANEELERDGLVLRPLEEIDRLVSKDGHRWIISTCLVYKAKIIILLYGKENLAFGLYRFGWLRKGFRDDLIHRICQHDIFRETIKRILKGRDTPIKDEAFLYRCRGDENLALQYGMYSKGLSIFPDIKSNQSFAFKHGEIAPR